MIDLDKFTYKLGFRQGLDQPFSQGVHTYACNGHILVRVLRRDGINGDGPDLEAAGLLAIIENGRATAPLPTVTVPVGGICQECGGDCKDEDGDGCYPCDGTGIVWHDEAKVWLTPTLTIHPRYYLWLAELPDVRIDLSASNLAVRTTKDVKADNARLVIAFNFNGGEGCLMPLRDDSKPNPNAPCFEGPAAQRTEAA